jgi:hypothetical protein
MIYLPINQHRLHSAICYVCLFLVFCPNPGPLLNGRIYVVLNDERVSPRPIRSEFRSYIPNVSHSRTIEFECNSGKMMCLFFLQKLKVIHLGYILLGPSGLTCNHGRWMPAERPRCVIGKF